MTGAIDLAFVDRADIKQYIGPPSAEAIYQIYTTCLDELMRVSETFILLNQFTLMLNMSYTYQTNKPNI